MTALSLAGLLASLVPAAIAAWRNPARDPEILLACLGTLAAAWVLTFIALVRFPERVDARPKSLLVHIVWGIVAGIVVLGQIHVPSGYRVALLLLPAPVHAIRLLRRPRALELVLAVQVAVLFGVYWVYSDPVDSTPSAAEVARAESAIADLPSGAPFSLYLARIAAEDHAQLRDVMVSVTLLRVSDIEGELVAALKAPASSAAALRFLESEKAPCNARLAEATAAVGVNLRACPIAP